MMRPCGGVSTAKQDQEQAEETYGLTWRGKRRAQREALAPPTGTLRPCPEESVHWESTQNLVIEGDNLEVLKLLGERCAGAVKLIYLDPPYNTGHDLVYADDFSGSVERSRRVAGKRGSRDLATAANEERSSRSHTAWLNMMYPRLLAARALLRRDGVLAVSIDETELGNLLALTDEIFGSGNRLGVVCVVNNLRGRSDDAFLATSHEYLVLCARSREHAKLNGLPLPAHRQREYGLEDEVGRYKLIPLKKTGKGWRRDDRPNMHFPIYVSADCSEVSLEPFDGGAPVLPMRGEEPGRWRWGKETFAARAARDVVARRVRGGGVTVFTKMRLGEGGEERALAPKTTWIDPKFDSAAGGRELDALGMRDTFPTPKPVAFLEELLVVASDLDSLVVDPFAGSGTTAQAVWSQNAKDGGRRRCILVQLPERLDPAKRGQAVAAQFCDALEKPRTLAEVTKERLRRAGEKITREARGPMGDVGFRVLRLEPEDVCADAQDLAHGATGASRSSTR